MKAHRPAQLAWIAQAALIVLPVVALSGMALHLLREDRTTIEQDAKKYARSLAPEVAKQLAGQISTFLANQAKAGSLTQGGFVNRGDQVNARVFTVPDNPRWPEPNAWPAKLSPREAKLWQDARDARFQRSDIEAADKALTLLTASGVNPVARANAQLGLLIAAEPRTESGALIRQAISVARQNPREVTEAGSPVADIALLLALRHVEKGNVPQELISATESAVLNRPSWLSSELLDALGAAVTAGPDRSQWSLIRGLWLQQEAQHERTRNVLGTLRWRLGHRQPTVLLYSDGDTNTTEIERRRMASPPAREGVAFCAPQGDGWRVSMIKAASLVRGIHLNLPDSIGATLNLDGERWVLGEKHASQITPLAWAKASFAMDVNYPFELILDLRRPEVWYAPYRRRLLLTQGLIVSAVVAALFSLWRLWQTYRDQTRLNEIKSNLVSSVSHELRAPLASVRLMAESLESGRVEGAEKQKDYYRLIVRECSRLSSLVENVLDFSRIDQGRKQYHPEPLDAAALLRHTVLLMEPPAAEHQVRLRLINPPLEFETLQPSWDSEAVEQSLVNLIDNAIKHSPSDAEVLVEVEMLETFVRFWIIDNGPGIPSEERDRIFDLFYRCGSELRRETEGVGIGLSITKHVAEAHGGRVVVESTPGHGSRFGLELPR